jgi:hypothetical protein
LWAVSEPTMIVLISALWYTASLSADVVNTGKSDAAPDPGRV